MSRPSYCESVSMYCLQFMFFLILIRPFPCEQFSLHCTSQLHNILEPVVRRPSGYSAKHCSKSLLKKDFIPFLSSYAHSSTITCTFLLF
jgi:hypothetical protein